MILPASLLHPVSASQPCGTDLAFSSEFDAIARARQYDDPSLDQGAWVVALKEADWPFVAARCAQLLEGTSKDLRLAVWLTEALAKTGHLRGLGDGLRVVAGLCQQFWSGLYPPADDGDHEQRSGNLFWLSSRLPQLLRELALTEDGEFALRDFEAARQRAPATGNAPAPDWGSATVKPVGPLPAQLDAARRANSPAYTAALVADLDDCLAALAQLEQASDARLGEHGPGFSAAREQLHAMLHLIGPRQGQGQAPDPDPDQGGAATGLAAAGADAAPHTAGLAGLASRQQALAQLRQVARYFRHAEPHSPVAYLADKAADWGELPLHVWLRAVVKDAALIAQLEDMLGSAPLDARRD